MDNPIKRKRKERWKIVEENEDGSYVKQRTNMRGDIIKKKITPSKNEQFTPGEKQEPKVKVKKTRAQKKSEKELQMRVAKEYPIFETKEEKKQNRQNIREFDRDRRRRQRSRRQAEREVIRAEKEKEKKPKKTKVKLGRMKGAYTSRGSSGGGSGRPSSCHSGQGGKCFDD